jgi:flavin-dependent dehydrogenase
VERFDAIVVGGGPAGATAALLLAQAGWAVALVERRTFPRRKVCGEYLSATNWPLLEALNLRDAFLDLAGPPVARTAVFAGDDSVQADLPVLVTGNCPVGRALSRERLDTLLLAEAAREGVAVHQPCRLMNLASHVGGHVCRIGSREPRQTFELASKVLIAAHGSWELGPLPTQRQHTRPRSGDLMAFKAHFRDTALPRGLMPLLSFPDGYGGMVHCDGGRASLSCCIRRDRLERLTRAGGQPAGNAVLGHILDSCRVLRPVLEGAVRDGPWLSAGPIQPGARRCYSNGVFVVGNAAGEAHPVVAEGISMAMQSAWLLARELIRSRSSIDRPGVRDRVAQAYTVAWRRSFVARIRAASAVASWAMRPSLVKATIPLLRACPGLLAWGARVSGKSHIVVQSGFASEQRCEPSLPLAVRRAGSAI